MLSYGAGVVRMLSRARAGEATSGEGYRQASVRAENGGGMLEYRRRQLAADS